MIYWRNHHEILPRNQAQQIRIHFTEKVLARYSVGCLPAADHRRNSDFHPVNCLTGYIVCSTVVQVRYL